MSGGPIIPVPSPPTILISDSDPTEYHRKYGNRRLRILAVQTRHARTLSQFESGTTGTRRSLITSRIHREREHIRFQAERRRPSNLHASSSTVPYNSTYKVRSVQMRHLRTYWKHVTDYERPRGRRVVRTLDRSARDLPLVSGTSIRPHRTVNTSTTSNNDTIRSRIVSPPSTLPALRRRNIRRMNWRVVTRQTIARKRWRGRNGLPSGPTRRAPRGIRIVAPDKMPQYRPKDDGPKGDKKAQYLIDPVHDDCPGECL